MGLGITGAGGKYDLDVSKNGQANVLSQSNKNSFYYSIRDGLTFNWVSEDDDAAAGDFVFYLKNDDIDRVLIVDLVRLTSEVAATWKIWEVTGTATGGSTMTAKNLNLGSGVTGSYTALGTSAIGGLTAKGSMIAAERTIAGGSRVIPFDDTLIIPVGTAIGVEYDTGSNGDVEVLLRGFFAKTGDFLN